MQRTDLQDTALWAHREVIKRVRAMTPEERLRRTNDLIVDLRELHKRANQTLKSPR